MPKAFAQWTVLPHGPIEKLAENLWRVEGTLPNMPLKRVMTLARMEDGRIVVHNGIALEDATMREIEEWGKPAFVLVPNGWHRLDSASFARRYPDAKVLCPEGSRKLVAEAVRVDGTYDDFAGDDTVSLRHLEGIARKEGVLRIRSSDGVTLVFNDLVFNMEHLPGLFGFVYRLLGSTGGPRVTRIGRWAIVKDRRAVRENLMDLAQDSDLSRVIPGHGASIAKDAGRVLRAIAGTV